MNIIEQLKEKYNLAPNSYYTSSPYGKDDKLARENHTNNYYQPFYDKWIKYTAENHYGPGGLGYPLPEVFYAALNEFLEYVLKECPDFKICQIKLKFGSVRAYLDGVSEKVKDECWELEKLLSDKHLIY